MTLHGCIYRGISWIEEHLRGLSAEVASIWRRSRGRGEGDLPVNARSVSSVPDWPE